jgi:glycerol-3-phosphate acyltransferase PlsX
MKIVLDGMGSDQYPGPEVTAAVQAALEFGDEIILTGKEDLLAAALESTRPRIPNGKQAKVRIVHAPEILEMTDKPAENARRKAQNSMAVGMELIRAGEADAFITAGNTGGAMVNGLFRLGRIRGVKRPGLTALFPVKGGKHTVVLDIGANAECKPEYLFQFAVLGSVYAQKVLGIPNPRVGLLSNGEEAGKGNQLIKDTYPLLESSGLNFIGNVEGKELFSAQADVVVTDGFTGNILLKSSEAVAKLITDVLKQELMANTRTKLGALLAKPAFLAIKKMLDPGETGAAPLLGINGLVFVGHGRSDAYALYNAIRVARQAVQAHLLEAMRDTLQEKLSNIKIEDKE